MRKILALLFILFASPSLAQFAGGGIFNPLNSTTQGQSPTGQNYAFSPVLAAGGTVLWLDSNDYASLTLSGSKVATINDKSGNSYNANQSGGAKPIWSSTGFNGTAPGMDFQGLDDLVVTDASNLQNIFSGGGTISLTAMATGNGSNSAIFYKSTNVAGVTTSGYSALFYGSGSKVTMRFSAGGSTTTGIWDTPAIFALNVPYEITISYNTSTPTVAPVITANGVTLSMTTVQAFSGTPGTDAGGNLIIGNNQDGGLQPFLGQIGQFTMYRGGVPSSSFLTQLQSYLGGLSGIKTALVSVLAGQSNMVGNGAVANTPFPYTPANYPNLQSLIWNGNTFSPLSSGNNNQGLDAKSIGPEVSFGAAATAFTGQPTYIVKYAVGATSLATNWNPSGPGAQWTGLTNAVNAALPAIALTGQIAVVNDFIWDQGETDAQNQTNANAYQSNLTAFAAALKSTLFASYTLSPNYLFVIAGLPNQSIATVPYQATVRAAQKAVGAAAGNRYVDTTNLALNADNLHFTAASEMALGNTYAAIVDSTYGRFTGSVLNNTNYNQNITLPLILGTGGYIDTIDTIAAQFTGNVNNYYQVSIQNTNSGSAASSDFVATADNGTATTHFINMGINSSNGGTSPFTSANAAYLYSTDNELDLSANGSSGVVNIYANGNKVGAFDGVGKTLTVPQLIFSPTTGGIKGTTTNDSASAGIVGETVTSTGTAVSLSSGTSANITSISLTAGQWLVYGSASFNLAGTTTATIFSAGISTTSATLPTVPDFATYAGSYLTGGNPATILTVPPQTLKLSGTTTVYLVANGSFAVSTATSTGKITAVRMR